MLRDVVCGARRGGPIIVDAADLPESLRAQLQALESARSRKRGEGGVEGAAAGGDDDAEDDEEDDPALVSAIVIAVTQSQCRRTAECACHVGAT